MKNFKKILVTGGTGYIGSHACVELIQNGYHAIALDNLSNSNQRALDGVANITGESPQFVECDLLDSCALDAVFQEHNPDAVIHFAGLKAVGESTELPLNYYQNNITGTLNLCQVMQRYDCMNLVFSSSCTVYGVPDELPITEKAPTGKTTNPYATSKLLIEQILQDLYRSDTNWNISILRYFNPVGAHESGLIGEDPTGIPNNLMPYITQVAVGKLTELSVFGDDYATPDGTCIRDYIHVVDLAIGHIKALEKLESRPGIVIHNLGTGVGYSVLDVIKAFTKAANTEISYKITQRRPGDLTEMVADPSYAASDLGWVAERGIDQMCVDAWNWQQKNPNGFV